MVRLEIGVTRMDPAWQQIFEQEHVCYRLWDKTFGEETPRVVVVNHPLNDEEASGFRTLVENGAGVLTDFANLARLDPQFKYQAVETIRYIEPQAHPVFDGLTLIDLELPGNCSNQANCGHLDNQGAALFAGNLGKGYVIALPFDVGAALRDTRRGLKAFYHEGPEFPYEETAVVGHGAIRLLCINALRELCRQVGVSYVHLWYYPEFKHTAFAFRVDGDFANKEEVEKTAALAEKHDLKFSWYVNTKAQRGIMPVFAALAKQGHDVQLHCHEHKVFDDVEHNRANLQAAFEVMKGAGFQPIGFVAPFGHWNPGLNQVLEESGITHSSEFCLAYDDLPFYPVVTDGGNERLSKVLQVPVHPICSGRLLQARLKSEGIVGYFKDYFRMRYRAREPLLLYDHPHRIAENYETFDAIFKVVARASDVWYTTFNDFQRWWRERAAMEFEAVNDEGLLKVEANYDPALALHVIDGDQEALIPLMTRDFERDDLNWQPVKHNYPYKPEMAKTRKTGRHIWLREQMWKAGRLFRP